MNFLKTRISRATYSMLLLAYAIVFAVAVTFQTRIPGELLLAFICIPRLHDMGRSGWWYGVLIVLEGLVIVGALVANLSPGIWIAATVVLLFAPALALVLFPGQAGPNRFGDAPGGVWERRSKTMAPWAVGALALMIAFGAWRIFASVHDGLAQNEKMNSSFFADPNNYTTVSVRGWRRFEINKIVSDFEDMYGMAASDFKVVEKSDDMFVIHFPNDVTPKELCFLVNYLKYPRGFDLTHRSVGVVAHVELTEAFGIPEPKLNGKHALIYVPAPDSRHDVVSASVQSEGTYVIPLTDFRWLTAPNAGLPPLDVGL